MTKKRTREANLSGCRKCDICNQSDFLVIHHIRGRKIRNFDDSFNRSNICQSCHYKVHLGEIVVEDWAKTSSGRELIWHLKGEDSITGNDAVPHMIKRTS